VGRNAKLAVAGVAGLALADAGVVALALPPIRLALHTTVAGVAAVLAVYALVLGLALPAAGHAAARDPSRLGAVGVAVFALASLGCGLAGSLPVLLVLRALQAAGGAAMLAAAFAVLADGGPDGGPTGQASARHPGSTDRTPPVSSAWRAATLLGTATGPALGGAITQVLGWRAIFLVQAPLVLVALPAFVRAARPQVPEGGPLPHSAIVIRAGVSLALVSAALTAVIFLTVLLLVTGWSVEPLAAAVVVSVLPLAAVAGARIRGAPAGRAAVGALLVAAGTACLAFVPTDTLWWVVGPEAIAGVGMGLALPALAGEMLPERTVRQATALLSTRHLGIAAGLAILAPVMTSSIDSALNTARLHGAALILDARIDPLKKLDIAPQLAGAVNTEQPLAGLRRVFRDNAGDIPDDQRGAWDALGRRSSQTLVAAVNDAFEPGYAVGAGLALLAALAITPWPSRRHVALAGAVVAAAILIPAGYALAADDARPPRVTLGDPCKLRQLPQTGGIGGFVQDTALVALDRAACHAGSSREALVLALASDSAAKDYQARYGLDPRSLTGLLGSVIGG
jgi:predicted MFS family arabinose efflux permease